MLSVYGVSGLATRHLQWGVARVHRYVVGKVGKDLVTTHQVSVSVLERGKGNVKGVQCHCIPLDVTGHGYGVVSAWEVSDHGLQAHRRGELNETIDPIRGLPDTIYPVRGAMGVDQRGGPVQVGNAVPHGVGIATRTPGLRLVTTRVGRVFGHAFVSVRVGDAG